MLQLFEVHLRRLLYKAEDILTCVLPRGYWGRMDVNVRRSQSVYILGHRSPSVAPPAAPVSIEDNTEFTD